MNDLRSRIEEARAKGFGEAEIWAAIGQLDPVKKARAAGFGDDEISVSLGLANPQESAFSKWKDRGGPATEEQEGLGSWGAVKDLAHATIGNAVDGASFVGSVAADYLSPAGWAHRAVTGEKYSDALRAPVQSFVDAASQAGSEGRQSLTDRGLETGGTPVAVAANVASQLTDIPVLKGAAVAKRFDDGIRKVFEVGSRHLPGKSLASPLARPARKIATPRDTSLEPSSLEEFRDLYVLDGVRVEKEPVRSAIGKAWLRFREGVEDTSSPLEVLGQEAGDRRMGHLLDRNRGVAGIANARAREIEDVVGGMTDEALDGLEAFAVARRQVEKYDQIKQRGGKPDATALRHSMERLDALPPEDYARFEEGHRALVEYSNRNVVEPLVEAGFISRSSADDVMAQNEWYIPFQKEKYALGHAGEGAADGAIRTMREGLSLKDGGRVESPIAKLFQKVQDVAIVAERQKVVNQIARYGDEQPELFGDLVSRKAGDGRRAVKVWKNGEESVSYISQQLDRSVEGLSPKQSGFVMKAAGSVMRIIRAGAITTPQFLARMGIRDVQQAAITSKYGFNPLRDIVPSMFEVAKKGGLYKQLESNGALNSQLLKGDGQYTQATLDEIRRGATFRDRASMALAGRLDDQGIKKYTEFLHYVTRTGDMDAGAMKILKTGFNIATAPVRGAVKALEAGANYGEEVTRLGVARAAKRNGASTEEMVREFRDSTVDFGRFGTYGRGINAYKLFANAAIQDNSKFMRAMKADPAGTTARAMRWITLPAVANWAMWKEDEDYQALASWDKAAFYHAGKTADGDFVRIPRGIGMLPSAFGLSIHAALDAAFSADPAQAMEMVQEITEQIQPGPLVSASGGADGLLANALPDAVQPFAEIAANYSSFRDGPIESRSMESLPLEDRRGASTHPSAAALGGKVGLSPVDVEHLAKGYGGYWGDVAMSAGDVAIGEEVPDRVAQKLTPGAGAFISPDPIGSRDRFVGRVYEESTRAAQESSQAKKIGRIEASSRYGEGYRQRHGQLAKVRSRIDSYQKAKKDILFSEGYTPEQKEEKLATYDRLISEAARAFYRPRPTTQVPSPLRVSY